MADRRIKRKREDVRKIRDVIKKEDDAREAALPPMVRDTGGSISNLKINTPVFQKWVTDLQEKVNPLIGKHVQDAPEYTINPLMLDQDVIDLTPDVQETIDIISESPEAEDLDNSPKKNHEEDKKFIDINIIENETRRMPAMSNEEITKNCEIQLSTYHGDKKYKTKMPIDEIITDYKDLLIAKAEEQKLLGNGDDNDPENTPEK